jgi:hypothetical protein
VDSAVVKNAVGALEKLLSQAKRALWQVEREVYGDPGYEDDEGTYEYPRYAMEDHLQKLHDSLLVVLEAADMPESRSALAKSWEEFKANKDGLRYTADEDEFQNCHSPALTFVERLVSALRMTVSNEISSEQAWTLSRLEGMLRDTPGLVHRRGRHPEDEGELQEIMHDYLSACFPDFRLNPPIGGTLKTFKPDCGIASVGAAIEFKIVHTKEKAAVAFSGVAEDTAGYKGSKDWTRFYAVIYQAKPFMLESHLRSDMKRIGAATWTPILVNGPARHKKRQKTPGSGQAS